MKTGFIGLGTLGKTMAKRLISEGTDLIVWNRTREKAMGLNAEPADSPADLISKVPITFMNLFDSDAVKSVLTSPDGILQGDCRDKVIIDSTTNHFEQVGLFHDACRARGAHYLEAPVLGSIVPASLGALTVLVSGEKSAFDRAMPYIAKTGKNIFFLEKPALATKMKLINNLVLGSLMATLAEAVAFGEAAGVDRAAVLDILAAGAGNSGVLNAKKEKLLKEDFTNHYSSALMYKDLHYLQDLAKNMKRPLFTGSVVKELFGLTFSQGLDGLDFSAIYKIMRDFSGGKQGAPG